MTLPTLSTPTLLHYAEATSNIGVIQLHMFELEMDSQEEEDTVYNFSAFPISHSTILEM